MCACHPFSWQASSPEKAHATTTISAVAGGTPRSSPTRLPLLGVLTLALTGQLAGAGGSPPHRDVDGPTRSP